MEEIELADEVGLDVFGVGEHHRPDFAVSAPAVVLAAAAMRTKRIRLTSAVTVLSSDDPVRVFQEFATVDLLSGGRAEIMAGRAPSSSRSRSSATTCGTTTSSSPKARPAARNRTVGERHLDERTARRSRPVGLSHGPCRTRCRSGSRSAGTRSALRAGRLGLPMALAIIGGRPERFVPFAELHRRAAREAGHEPPPRLSINSHGYVADTAEQAADEFFPPYAAMMNAIGAERGWPPVARQDFDALRTLRGALVVGNPQQVVEKILFQHDLFGHQRFLAQIGVGTLPHAQVLRAIELLGTEVAPAVRAEVARRLAPYARSPPTSLSPTRS